MDKTLSDEQPGGTTTGSASGATRGSGRVTSIDALRGFDMFWIIGGRGVFLAIFGLFVTPIPESVQKQMDHPAWVGFSAWDMIMPLFLFVVGVVMPFSFARRLEQGQSKARLYRKIVIRTLVLFVLGMVAQGNLLDFDLSKFHIYSNTLQAIACGYLVAAILLLDLSLFWQILITAALLVGYWELLMAIPVPGYEAGILEPRLNLALYVDKAILGRFEDGLTYTWILSGMGFAATVMLGVFTGQLLRSKHHPWMKVLYLLLMGGGCLGLGWLWSPWFPIIKHIWSSSMVLWAGGWSILLLALFYMVIDVIGLRWLAFPLVVIGSNAIAVYMVTRLIDFRHLSDPFVHGLARHLDSAFGVLYQVGSGDAVRQVTCGDALRDVAALAVIWLILLYMYRKRTLIRV
jgi:predicted acyltransferase